MPGHLRCSRTARLLSVAAAAVAVIAGTSVSAIGAQVSPAVAGSTAAGQSQAVIVVLKTQFAAAHEGTRAAIKRAAAAASAQAPLLNQLHAAGAAHVKTYSLVDALAATVSAAELAQLKSDPAVAEVVPDVTIDGPDPLAPHPASAHAKKSTHQLSPNTIPGACSATSPQLEPEGLTLTHTASYRKSQPTARSLGITGSGVKVAWIGDGVDTQNVNFVRENGTSVFSDYQDFSGDGPGQPTSGALAFSDANTIAGQGRHVYNVQDFSAQPDASACEIRIQGVAPGASLVGLDVYGENEDTTESDFLQALNYAVETDHVNVIDESFGLSPFPDVTALDITKQFNDAAVAAGVVVTVSSGDGGPDNTIGSPASDPDVISVGASTDFRFYAQTNYAAADYFAANGWLDDNPSSLSSTGYDETGQLINLLAPGDSSFASCDASAQFAGCVNFAGQSSDVELSGGTEEASSFAAGAAALVIQAYQRTHGGVTPTPAVVKQILLSTATDLGAPAPRQGSGLLNSYKAVQLAESMSTADGSPAATGSTLLKSATSFSAVRAAGQAAYFKVTLTNTGTASQTVGISGRTMGPNLNTQQGNVTLTDGTSPSFLDEFGVPNNYEKFTFQVQPGMNQLEASIGYPGDPFLGNLSSVNLTLINPQGKLAASSQPLGAANFTSTEVTDPTPGTWTGVVFGDVAAFGGTNGVVPWRVTTARYLKFGTFNTPSVKLAPGKSRTIHFHEVMPSAAGDRSASVVFTSKSSGTTTIPVNLRTYITFGADGTGSFQGRLTGGNGAGPGEGEVDYYEFKVGSGVNNITANLNLTNDPADPVAVYLVNPEGEIGGYGQNSLNGQPTTAVTAWADDVIPGNWVLIAEFASPVAGNEVSQIFRGDIVLNGVAVSSAGLPDSASVRLKSGTPVTVPVSITNNGDQAEEFFIDPRLDSSVNLNLTSLNGATGLSLPLAGEPPLWLMPTHSMSVAASASASLPVQFDYATATGDPDLGSGPAGTNVGGSYTVPAGNLTNGIWFAEPSEAGPYAAPAPAGVVSMSMQALSQQFDTSVTSATGDYELNAIESGVSFTPVIINAGQTATINVTVTPPNTPGAVVSGTLYIDDLLDNVPPYGQSAVDELTGLPYEYTVGA